MAAFLGHALILVSFGACIAATWFYFSAARTQTPSLKDHRQRDRGRMAWIVSTVAALGASVALMYLILTHQFQYNYVYSYTSLDLPFFYTFSAFWAGQEGSFLLWVLFNALIGLGLIYRADAFEAPVMAIIAFCQFFMISMILGIDFGALKLGVSPFLTLVERYPDAPIMQQAGFVPADGQGLNDLLQNPWMVIHPPVLFIGFAAMAVPFAYAVAGLWQRRYTQWVHLALPWTLFANLTLMAGIALGGYWAYETLSFGGYWAWDPVENTSLVPWIISVAAIHAMVAQRKSGTNHKASFLLNILAFLLVIYSTFLTRSGVLSDTSVHSFVDLGLYNQLLLWIVSIALVGFGLYLKHHRHLPAAERETNLLSREFLLLFSGEMVLAAMGTMILLGTSAPIVGRLFQENPSAVDIWFYNKWSVPLMAGMAFLLGLAQLFWWRQMTREQVNDAVFKPLLLATICTAGILLFTPFTETVIATGLSQQSAAAPQIVQQSGMIGSFSYYINTMGPGLLLVLLLFSAFFAVFSSIVVLWRIGRGNLRMIGGGLTHLGFMLMVLGILASSLFNNPISDGQPRSGNNETFVLEEGQPRTIEGYRVRYDGREVSERGRTTYLLTFEDAAGRSFEARPVTYKNNRGQWIQSPETKSYLEKDLFIAVSPRAMFDQGGSEATNELLISRGDTLAIDNGKYLLHFKDFDMKAEHPELPSSATVAVAAVLEVTESSSGEQKIIRPLYYMGEDHGVANQIPDTIEPWNLSVTLVGMQVNGGAVRLQVTGAEVPQHDWLVVQAYEKPFMNVLWFGVVVMMFGFGVSLYRRVGDDRLRFHREHPEEHKE